MRIAVERMSRRSGSYSLRLHTMSVSLHNFFESVVLRGDKMPRSPDCSFALCLQSSAHFIIE